MDEIILTLPFPQSVNHYKRVGRIVKTKSGQLYQNRYNTNETNKFYFDVYMIIKKEMPFKRPIFADDDTIDLEVTVELHPPHQKRYDADNRLKVLLDSLVRARIIKDDSQITRLVVEKKAMIQGGKTIVRIKPYVTRTDAQEVVSARPS